LILTKQLHGAESLTVLKVMATDLKKWRRVLGTKLQIDPNAEIGGGDDDDALA